MKKSNPHLKELLMDVVDNQIRNDDPPETRQTFNSLISQGISEEDAKIHIGQAVCVEIWDIMRNRKEFNKERFVRNLKRLPEEPIE